MDHRVAPQPGHQRAFAFRESGGRPLRTVEQALELVGRSALREHQPGQQPIARGVAVSLPGQPPADPGPMTEQRIEQLKDRPPVAVVELAPGPEERKDDGIRRARGARHVVQEIKCGLQAGSRGHGGRVGWKALRAGAQDPVLSTIRTG